MNEHDILISIPFWGLLYGPHMKVETLDTNRFTLAITGEKVNMVVRKASTVHANMKGWIIDWKIKSFLDYPKGTEMKNLNFSKKDIETLFGLNNSHMQINGEIKKAAWELLKLAEEV